MKTLTTHSKSSFPPLLSLTYLLQHKADAMLTSEAGLSLSHAHIMSALHASVSRTQRHVAASLHQTESNISRQLRVMKKQGLVSITKSKKDGRQRDVKLTVKGHRKYQKAENLLKKQAKNYRKLLTQTVA